MQRKRIKRVIDPIKSITALQVAGYSADLNKKVSGHAAHYRDANIVRYNVPYLTLAAVPLAYLSKSIFVPMLFLNISLYGLLFKDLTGSKCFYC